MGKAAPPHCITFPQAIHHLRHRRKHHFAAPAAKHHFAAGNTSLAPQAQTSLCPVMPQQKKACHPDRAKRVEGPLNGKACGGTAGGSEHLIHHPPPSAVPLPLFASQARQGKAFGSLTSLPLMGTKRPEKAAARLSLPCSASAEWGRCPEGAEGASAKVGRSPWGVECL